MVLKEIKWKRLKFWHQWLLHWFSVWFLMTLADALDFILKVSYHGNILFNPDGSPVTLWQRFVNHNVNQLLWLDILVLSFFVEGNYRLFSRRRKIGLLLLNSIGIGVGLVLLLIFQKWWYQHLTIHNLFLSIQTPIVVVAGYAFIYALIRDYIFQRVQQAEVLYHSSSAELKALKAQINPHFFFNVLNSLYGTALQEKAEQTAESIEQLSGIMRYTMNEAQQEFTAITHEIKFLEDYLHLQRLRLPDRENIELQTQILYDGKFYKIAPMLLIPFIENAFKYGISMEHKCFVHIRLKIEKGELDLSVQNKVLEKNSVARGPGTGIKNAKKRLQLLYPQQHQLDIQEDVIFRVALHINI